MSESETTPEIGPRFTKATIIRISAVAFFVTLGSVAVIQSMKYVSSDSNENPSQLVSDTDNPISGKETLPKETTSSEPPSAFNEPSKSTADKNTFSLPDNSATSIGKPVSTELGIRTAPPENSSFKPTLPPFRTSTPIAAARQSEASVDKKKPSNTGSGFNGIPIVKATPPTSPPERFASKEASLPFSNSNSGFKPPTTPTQDSAPQTSTPKQTNTKKPDPFQISTPPKQGSDIPKPGSSSSASASNSASRLLEQLSDDTPSTRPVPMQVSGVDKPAPFSAPAGQPIAKSFTPPTKQPSQPKLPTSQSPQSNSNESLLTNIGSFNNRPRPTGAPAGSPSSSQTKPEPEKAKSNLNEKFPESAAPKVPSAFASQTNIGKTPTPTARSFEAPQSKSGTGSLGTSPGLTSQTNSSNPQAPRAFAPNPTSPRNAPSSNRSSLTGLVSTSPTTSTIPVPRLTRDTPGDRQLEGIQAPSLTVEKLSPAEIQLNQKASFEIIVRNIGRVTAEEVKVVDQVPAGCEFVGATPQTQPQGKLQSLSWNLGTLRPGQEKKITFQLKPTQPGEMGSVAQVSFATQASMRTLVTKPVLEIVHQTEATHLIGDRVILDVIVINKGDGPAKNVLIQQQVPEQLEFPDGLPNASRGIEYEVGTLMPGKSQRVKLALKAANIGKIQSIMYASAEGGLRAKHELPIEVIAPKLVTQSSGPKKRFLKRSATHEFRVANQGTANATNVQLIAKLPNGLRFVQANNQGRYDSNSHAVYWSLAELAQNIEAKVELKTMPVDVGNQPITFESSADLNIKSALEHDLSVEHLVDVFFEIDDVIDPIEIGGDTRYRVRVVNQGTKAATNIRLQVDFPAGITPTSVNGSLRHAIRGQQIVFEPINNMNPDDELSFMINGRGQSAGDHRVVVSMQTDGRTSPVSKQESTRVYSDQ